MTRFHHYLPVIFIIGALIIPAKVQANCGSFSSGPVNKTLTLGEANVEFTCNPPSGIIPNAIIWEQSLNGVLLNRVFSLSNDNPELFTFNNGKLLLSNVTALHHGEYHCTLQQPCSHVTSSIGYVKVMSPVNIVFNNPQQANGVTSGGIGEPLVIPFYLFGSPSPQLKLFKQTTSSSKRAIDGYTEVNDPRIIISLTGVTFQSLDFSNEGMYMLVSNNTEGEFSIPFTVDVTGVIAPNVTITQSQYTPQSYGDQSLTVTCIVPKNSFDSDSGGLTLTWRQASNNEEISVSEEENIYQIKLNNTAVALNIQKIEESNNGGYRCFAENSVDESTGLFYVRGPPTSVSNLKHVSFGNDILLTWDAPNSYGAKLKIYMIQYSKQGIIKTVSQTLPTSGSPQHIVDGVCPNGIWNVTVWAVNEFDGVGSPTEKISVAIMDRDCDPSESTTTSITNNVQPTTTTESVRVTITSTQDISFTTGVTEPTTGSNTGGISSIPIAAGAAAGAFILIIFVAVLVFAVACYITVNRKGSKSRAEQQWRQNRYSNEHINGNGYVETNSMPTKSPDSQMNSYEVALPSPLPATPGYGPVYIDPHFEFPRENLEFTDILYDGAYTVIYKAKAVGIKENKPIDVAVKSLKEEFLDYDDYSSALVMEMEQLAQLEPHPNIVGLVRVCSVTRPVLMVMEYMCHGDLLGFLRTTRGHTDMYTVNPGTKNLPTHLKLTSRDLLSIIKQVATGMQFLSEQKIVHGALCARNVLVSTSMEVKIFNIGIHNLDNDETFESLVRWMAPEVFVDGIRTAYGDIWSFGILMWEVVTLGGTPYADLVTDDLYTQLMAGVRLQKPPHCAQPVYDAMTMCWETIPQHRPLFFEIIDLLQNFNVSKMSYLDLRNYNENAYSQFDESERQQTSIL